MSGILSPSGEAQLIGRTGDRVAAAAGALAAGGARRGWQVLRDRWQRDPIEIEIRLEEAGQTPMARVGGSKRLIEIGALRRRFRLLSPFTSVTVTVPARHCLIRALQIPQAALARADEILRIDMERTTPFRDEVLTGWHRATEQPGGELVTLHHVILKRDLIDPVLAAIEAAGLPVTGVRPLDADGKRLPVNLLPAAQRRGASAAIGLRNAALICVAALCALTIAAIWLTVSSLDTALARADDAVRQATEKAHEVNRIVSEADKLSGKLGQPRLSKIGTTPLTVIWEEVTRLLPDSTWLASLRLEDDTVQIEGNSSNASELIPLLASSPLFRNVAFASPVTRDPQRGTERFQIKITVKRSKAAAAEPASGEAQ
jgi:general secretion pathway protein L